MWLSWRRSHIKLLVYVLLNVTFLYPFSNAQDIYYQGKISAYRILQKVTCVLFSVESMEVYSQSWLHGSSYHTNVKTRNFIQNSDDYKVEGRISFLSIVPAFPYSSSHWVQEYRISGVPFSRSSQEQEWKMEVLSIEDKKAR